MSATIVGGRIAVPALSFHRCRHLIHHHHHFLSSIFKRLVITTAASPSIPIDSNTTETVTTRTPNSSFYALQSLSSQQKDQISLYANTLLEWNLKMNLTAVSEAEEVMTRHVEDSLAILPPLQWNYSSNNDSFDEISVVDVGTGAGLPGVILAIARPSWKFTLLESMQKRCTFLEYVVDVVGLSNVRIVRGRAENVGQNSDFREVFDIAVARAVAEMRILAEYCLPLVRVGGLFVAAKGYDPKEEVKCAENAIRQLGGTVLELCNVESHSPLGQRTAIICLKERQTPRKYPRHPGIPAKLPL